MKIDEVGRRRRSRDGRLHKVCIDCGPGGEVWFDTAGPTDSRPCASRPIRRGQATAVLLIALILAAGPSMAETVNFDAFTAGQPPPGWRAGVTGSGTSRWLVETDTGAPSGPNVLRQSGRGAFPWCVIPDARLVDAHVQVKFKSISGREDQAGGLVWRWKDGDNYYVARANALENNVSLYYTEKGRRNTIKYVDAPVSANQWHDLSVEFVGDRIQVALDGKLYIDVRDGHIAGEGAVGVWTKADSVTAFDDFQYDKK